MFVNPSLQTIFLANPKCGSSSLESFLRQCEPIMSPKNFPSPPFGLPKHIDAKFLKEGVMPIVNSTYPDLDFTVFCIVRDPFDRLYSHWKYKQGEKAKGTPQSTIGISFENYVQDVIELREGLSMKPHAFVRSQVGYIYNDRELICEKVFAIEKINEAEEFLSERCGKQICLETLNKSIPLSGDPKKISDELMQRLKICLKREFEIHQLASVSPDEVRDKYYEENRQSPFEKLRRKVLRFVRNSAE